MFFGSLGKAARMSGSPILNISFQLEVLYIWRVEHPGSSSEPSKEPLLTISQGVLGGKRSFQIELQP